MGTNRERRQRRTAYQGKDRRARLHPYPSESEQDILFSMLQTALGEEVRSLLLDEHVEELRVNADKRVWVVKHGIAQSDGITLHEADTERVIRIMASCVNFELSAANSSFSAEMPQSGFRFHGVVPPQTSAPVFVIRKKPTRIIRLEEYVTRGIMTQRQSEIIRAAVYAKENMLIVGGTASGKTTLANAILKEIAGTGDRIGMVEDTLELICTASEVISMRTHSGRTMRDCIRDLLRMTPDRIIVGEVRGAEVIEMLTGWNTGHPGGLATIHANSASESMERIEDLFRQGNALPSRRAIARTIDVVIYIGKTTGTDETGGRVAGRRVQEVLRLTGLDDREQYIFETIV